MKLGKNIGAAFLAALLLTQSGCGTLLYPERVGQKGTQLDPAVVILDGIGLFFFVIPGLLAFAVDFSNGSIYLPAAGSSAVQANNARGPERLTADEINTVIEDKTQIVDVLSRQDLVVTRSL